MSDYMERTHGDSTAIWEAKFVFLRKGKVHPDVRVLESRSFSYTNDGLLIEDIERDMPLACGRITRRWELRFTLCSIVN